MEGDTTCSNGTESGDSTPSSENTMPTPSIGAGAEEPTTSLNNDRSKLWSLIPGVCERIIAKGGEKWTQMTGSNGSGALEWVTENIGCYDLCFLEGG